MVTNIEIEYKQLLSNTEYNLLYDELTKNKHTILNQENIYFDSINNDLRDNNQALRIRLVNNEYELCLKTKEIKAMSEKNIIITNKEFELIIKDLSILNSYFSNYNFTFIEIGRINTKRLEVKVDNGLFCLDHSYYNNDINKCDYEIEFEAIDFNQETYLKEYLAKYDITYTNESISKIKRCISSK